MSATETKEQVKEDAKSIQQELFIEPVSQKDIKLNAKIREFERVLSKVPAKIGDTALATWTELGPFTLEKYLD